MQFLNLIRQGADNLFREWLSQKTGERPRRRNRDRRAAPQSCRNGQIRVDGEHGIRFAAVQMLQDQSSKRSQRMLRGCVSQRCALVQVCCDQQQTAARHGRLNTRPAA
ncbi:MAG: hypothetical protein BWY63_02686 [Chloroflexi bacterium ADurb.Bin360]|nr:MAG: hypothetical protein BWY63_02686 [Chloroflexi bacterium ADurb.Bin360]